ncbi:MAG: transglutaminase family protein [Bacteroidetes bacterium]|nr:transglutaminase family protein [Bacteroidota bacterium]
MNGLTEKEISEIRSLITLIDDEDETVYAAARARLLSYKDLALDYLPFIDEKSTIADKRLSEVREILIRASFKEQLRTLRRDHEGNIELEDAVFLIARQRYLDLDTTTYIDQLNRFAAELKDELSSVADEEEILRRIITFFTVEKKFEGNREEYYSEENHYINRVLDTKIGIPITLSIVYLLVGQRIDLPLRGIGLPGHFIMRFSFGKSHVFFDPFNGGKILSRADCEAIVKNLGFNFSEEYLEPVSNKQILERMLRNIILTLEKKQENDRIETIRQFIDTLNSDL